MDGRAVVVRCDLDRGMDPGGGRPSNQERHLESLALELARDERHLLERRRDESAQSDEIHLLAGGLEDRAHGTMTPRSITS